MHAFLELFAYTVNSIQLKCPVVHFLFVFYIGLCFPVLHPETSYCITSLLARVPFKFADAKTYLALAPNFRFFKISSIHNFLAQLPGCFVRRAHAAPTYDNLEFTAICKRQVPCAEENCSRSDGFIRF